MPVADGGGEIQYMREQGCNKEDFVRNYRLAQLVPRAKEISI